MKVLSLFILINVLTVEVFAQDLNVLSLTKTINGEFEYFMPDELGNLFGLTKNGQLKKYNNNLDSMGVFNNVRRYGKLFSISADNPLRTVLYFKEYRTILVLDRLMQVPFRRFRWKDISDPAIKPEFGVIAHQPEDGVRPVLPARQRRVARPALLLHLGQAHLGLGKLELVLRILLGFGDLVACQLA